MEIILILIAVVASVGAFALLKSRLAEGCPP